LKPIQFSLLTKRKIDSIMWYSGITIIPKRE
jgi:hypothetical protein